MKGKGVRLSRLFKHSRRMFIIPMDHGVTVGPIAGLQDMGYIVKQVTAGGADAVIVHKGLVGQITDYLGPGGVRAYCPPFCLNGPSAQSQQKGIGIFGGTCHSPGGNRGIGACKFRR